MLLKYAIKALIGNKKFSLFFILNLSIGLIGFITLDSFKESFVGSLEQSSKSILTADLEVSSRVTISKKNLKLIEQKIPVGTQHVKLNTLYSMVTGASSTRLVEIKVIEGTHPLYGYLKLRNQGTVTSKDPKDISHARKVWIYPELMTLLGVKVGDELKIGYTKFKISDVVEDDPGMAWTGTSMAPRIYIGQKHLKDTGLVQKGSTIRHTRLFKLPNDRDPRVVSKELRELITDSAVVIKDHFSASEQTGRLIAYLTDYLGLVAISALFLAGLGASYLFRNYLVRSLPELATLVSLGSPFQNAALYLFIQVALLGLVSTLVAIMFSLALNPLLPALLSNLLSIEIQLTYLNGSILKAFAIGLMGSLFISIPFIQKVKSLKPSMLFQEGVNPTLSFSKMDLILYFPSFIFFWILACLQANSIIVGSLFIAMFFGSAILLFVTANILLTTIKRLTRHKNMSIRLASLYLTRLRTSSLICFLALSLGAVLINLIPQIKVSLEAELESPEESKLPSLFLFDIQDEQLTSLEEFLTTTPGKLGVISPLVRARLTAVNGKQYKPDNAKTVTREEEQEQRFRNRGFNLSYRLKPDSSETIVAGEPFSGAWTDESQTMPEISLEKRFADRLKLGIGDKLKFDIQGVDIVGVVTSLRTVQWTSFQPNFFVQFQPGVLDYAPKTFIASIPSLPKDKSALLQKDLVEKFPNVSIIDVSRLVNKILDIILQMSWVLQYMALLSLGVGFMVVYSIANHQVKMRARDISLLKILGSEVSTIQKSMYYEFGLMAISSAILGGIVATLLSYGISSILFDSLWAFDWQTLSFSSLMIIIITLWVVQQATKSTLMKKPKVFL